METMTDLIDESVATDQIIHAEYSDALADALRMEADGSADTAACMEFWGATDTGAEWRVHLDR